MIGKEIRLSKLIDACSGKIFIVPMDHGVTLGAVEGIKNSSSTVKKVLKAGVNTFVVHKGVLAELAAHKEVLPNCNFILHLSASTNLNESCYHKRLVSSVEQAVKMGASGVSVHINLGNEAEGCMLEDLGRISDDCMNWGMPLLAMMYIRDGNREYLTPENVAHAARIAQEMGADIVKVSCLERVEDMVEVVESVNIPVIVSGGPSISIEKLLFNICQAMKGGVAGVAIGRNIFQANNSEAVAKLLLKVVNMELSYEDALAELEKSNRRRQIS